MAFLYTLYIVVYACLSYGLGRAFDYYNTVLLDPRGGLFWLAGVMMSIACVMILAASFVPKGAFGLNPTYADMGIVEEEPEKKDETKVESQEEETATNSDKEKEKKDKEETEVEDSSESDIMEDVAMGLA